MIETDVTVIGGGIVGLAIARELLVRRPDRRVVLLEKESRVATHQTGRNSGVIHSGIYYAPGSEKARLARSGCDSIKAYCREQGIPFRNSGKLIVATEEQELTGLRSLLERAEANGIKCEELTSAGAREIEPAVSCIRALRVPAAGVVDYNLVAERLKAEVEARGGQVLISARVSRIMRADSSIQVGTRETVVKTAKLISAAGLHSDTVAALDDTPPAARIIPFRGEYYEVDGPSADLVRGLIYPVPDVRYPFLGVHLTRSVNDIVHAGPNAVLALAREGYDWMTVSPRDLISVATYPGFWRFIRCHLGMAGSELRRSLSRRQFARSVQRLVPSISEDHLVRSPAGVRAQALTPEGELVDDFLIEEKEGAFYILNAPSPAATSALELARVIVSRVDSYESPAGEICSLMVWRVQPDSGCQQLAKHIMTMNEHDAGGFS